MKAGSRAQKIAAKVKARRAAAKRGRPPMQDVFREPNGRISRAKRPPEPADKLALEVRARQLGVSVEAARDPRLGSYIGRLAILGAQHGGLSEVQYGAALRFMEIYNDWRKAVLSPAALWDEKNLTGEEIGLSVEEATDRAKARYEGAMKALGEAQAQAPYDNLYASLQYLVIEDRGLPRMVGGLRLALNALARHFGMNAQY